MQREKGADPDIQLVCDDSNIFKWTALIKVTTFILIGLFDHYHFMINQLQNYELSVTAQLELIFLLGTI